MFPQKCISLPLYTRGMCRQLSTNVKAVHQSVKLRNTVCISRLVSTSAFRSYASAPTATGFFKYPRNLQHWKGHFERCFCTSTSDHVTPVFLQAAKFENKLAVVTQHGKYTYQDLLQYSLHLADEITSETRGKPSREVTDSKFSLQGERVAFLCDNDMSYIVSQWAIWMCGGIAVPLCNSHPISELEYFVTDSGSCLMIASENYKDKLKSISEEWRVPLKVLSMDHYSGDYEKDADLWEGREGHTKECYLQEALLGDKYRTMKAMIIYTSGTTGRPKGVVYTHGNMDAQMKGMIEAWRWTSDDVILHVLPLHHVHGIVNVLMTSLYCGATCVMLTKFDAKATWSVLLNQKMAPQVNLFMAVPTIYAKLLEYESHANNGDNEKLPDDIKDILKKKIRLMVSGSAALPQPIMDRWETLTGHTLLERYGMTEIGMALTNPLDGTRVPGAVGLPFPGVSVCIVNHHDNNMGYDVIATANSDGASVTPGMEEMSGELLVKGDNVFKEYWNKPGATAEAFTEDGWFKTGDTAVCKDNVFRIVGRTSVDVIKSGAYKISALDIERQLLGHPGISDVAVLGLPDETWGQKVAAVIVVRNNHSLDLNQLKAWARDKMAPYHIPRVLKCLSEMPRNAMGKVNKKELSKSVFPEYYEK